MLWLLPSPHIARDKLQMVPKWLVKCIVARLHFETLELFCPHCLHYKHSIVWNRYFMILV